MILMMKFHDNLAPAMSLLIISQLGAFILVVTIAQNGLWSKNMSKDSKSMHPILENISNYFGAIYARIDTFETSSSKKETKIIQKDYGTTVLEEVQHA